MPPHSTEYQALRWYEPDRQQSPRVLVGDEFFVLLDASSRRWQLVDAPYDARYSAAIAEGLFYFEDQQPADPEPTTIITVFLSNKCNLRCSYCRFEQWTHHDLECAEDDEDSLLAAISRIAANKTKVGIYFQGGEPLLFWEKIDRICTAITESGEICCEVDFYIQTNGTVLTSAIIELVEKHSISIGISLDGDAARHDQYRPYTSGKGSQADILRTLDTLEDNGIPSSVFSVITDPDDMLERYRYLADERKLRSFLLAPLELDGDEEPGEVGEYLRKFIRGQMDVLRESMRRFESTGIKVVEGLTHNYLQRKIFPERQPPACEVTPHSLCGQSMVSLERDGGLSDCQQLRQKRHLAPQQRIDMKRRYGICEACVIKGHCSGPVCFSRFSDEFNAGYRQGGRRENLLVETICHYNKERELALFDVFRENKRAVLNYFFGINAKQGAKK